MNRHFSIKKGLFSIAGLQFFLAMAFLIYSVFMNTYQIYNDASNRYYQTGEQMLTNAETYIGMLEQATLFPSRLYTQNNDSYICRTLREGNVLKNFKFYTYFDSHARTELSPAPIDFIAVYDLKGNGVASPKSTAYRLCFIHDDPGWLKELSQFNTGTPLLIPPQRFYGSGMHDKDFRSICMARGIMDLNTIRIVGYCVAGMDTDYLVSAFHQIRLAPNQKFALYKDQIRLFGTIDDSFDCDSYANSPVPYANGLSRHVKACLGEWYVYNSIFHGNGYSLVIQTPLTDVIGGLSSVHILYTLVICLILFIIMAIITTIIKKILSSLDCLIEACNHFELGHATTVSTTDFPLEIQVLSASFNRMSNRISLLIQEVFFKQQKQQETELQLLRTQINPHYLYNTLEIMHMKAYSHKDYDVSSMAELLGQNLQYGLRNTTSEVTLKEELKQVDIYLSILAYQYGDRILTNIFFEEELMDCPIIKLIFQPIIENAVIHGMESKDQTLSIDILGYRQDDRIIIQISDDGKGMTQEQLTALRRNIQDTADSSIGLRNVCRRIQLFYGQEYTTDIDSKHQVGTIVTLQLPWRTNEA
ncbi:MAG: histidine kinase [Hungatella sp.]|nr:histidine kinase [Hungatella sp.]